MPLTPHIHFAPPNQVPTAELEAPGQHNKPGACTEVLLCWSKEILVRQEA